MVCGTVVLAVEPLVRRGHGASLSLFCRYYFGRCSGWLNWFHFLILVGGQFFISIGCTVVIKDLHINCDFPRKLYPGIIPPFFPSECFPWIYDLNSFKPRVKKQVLQKKETINEMSWNLYGKSVFTEPDYQQAFLLVVFFFLLLVIFVERFKLLSRHWLVQSHQQKQQNHVWNLFKVKNKDTRKMSLLSFIVDFEQVNATWVIV